MGVAPMPHETPDPGNADWIDFLRWCDLEHPHLNTIDVVEKPWHYADLYHEYLALGGTDR